MSAASDRYWRDQYSRVDIGLNNRYRLRPLRALSTGLQRVELCDHSVFGRMLFVDQILVAAEHHSARAELLSQVPLRARDDIGSVLILGGGSGAVLRETLRCDRVRAVCVLEPDAGLIDFCREHYDADAAFADARVELVSELDPRGRRFDLIIDDADDGAGRCRPALAARLDPQRLGALFAAGGVGVDARPVLPDRAGRAFSPLPAGGSERPFDLLDATGRFAAVDCYQGLDALAPGGVIGCYLFATDARDYRAPRDDFSGRTYTPALHRAAFALPHWWAQTPQAPRRAPPTPPVGGEDWIEQTQNTDLSQRLTVSARRRAPSEFQTVEFFDHALFGRALALDGTVQCTEADEYIYHEMAVLVPLFGRPRRPGSVRALIVGGGDGGILRELLRHDCVAAAVMVEIDRAVVDGCIRHLGIHGDYDDPRARLIIGDAAEYAARAAAAGDRFELIIVDATDSTAPSDSLWNEAFFRNLQTCLSDDGVCVDSDILIHGRRTLLSRDVAAADQGLHDVRRAKQQFASVQGYHTRIPSFPGGGFALFLYGKDGHDYAEPAVDHYGRHYTPALHRAAFALPHWWRQLLERL